MFRKKKCFLDIMSYKITSQSIVFAQDLTKIPVGVQQSLNNPFLPMANLLLLQKIVGKKGFQSPQNNPMQHQFVLEDCVIAIDVIPYRLTIQRNINDQSLLDIINIAQALINEANISDRIEFIGINYELMINNKDGKIKLTEKVLNHEISSDFIESNITMVKNINDVVKLNFNIADAIYEAQKSIYVRANFETKITTNNTFNDFICNDFFKEINKTLKLIYPDYAK